MFIGMSGNRVLLSRIRFSAGIETDCQANCQTSLQDFLVFMFISVVLIYRTHCSVSHCSISYYREVINWVLKFELFLFCFATDMLYAFEQQYRKSRSQFSCL